MARDYLALRCAADRRSSSCRLLGRVSTDIQRGRVTTPASGGHGLPTPSEMYPIMNVPDSPRRRALAESGARPMAVLHPGDLVTAERRPRTLKHGDTFGLFDHYGDIGPEKAARRASSITTRASVGLQLLINDRRPLLLSSTVQDNNAAADRRSDQPRLFRRGRLHCRATPFNRPRQVLWQGRRYERLAVRNFGDRAARIRLTLLFQSRFRRSVRGARPSAPGARPRSRRGRGRRSAVVFDLPRSGRRRAPHRRSSSPRPARSRSRGGVRTLPRARSADFAVSGGHVRRSLARPPGPRGSSSPCARRGARCAVLLRAAARSRPRMISSTRCSAARSPISTC